MPLLGLPALLRPLPADPLARRDPEFLRAQLPVVERLIRAWFAPELTGLEHLECTPALIVGMHNGGPMVPDGYAFVAAAMRHLGLDRPLYFLGHDLVFLLPVVGRWIALCGGVPATPGNALALLGRGHPVLVYPGGELDAYKPFARRHQVVLDERAGFVRVALAAQVPIVPVVSVGAHQSWYVLTDGRALAGRLGLGHGHLRLKTLPVALSLPWGISVGHVTPYLPIPSRVRVRVLPPIDPGLPAAAAADPEAVLAVRARVLAAMQAAVDAMVAEGGFGLRARLRCV